MSTSTIMIILIFAVVAAIEIPIVVAVLARSGSPQTRRVRVATGLFVVIFLTAILAAVVLPKIIR